MITLIQSINFISISTINQVYIQHLSQPSRAALDRDRDCDFPELLLDSTHCSLPVLYYPHYVPQKTAPIPCLTYLVSPNQRDKKNPNCALLPSCFCLPLTPPSATSLAALTPSFPLPSAPPFTLDIAKWWGVVGAWVSRTHNRPRLSILRRTGEFVALVDASYGGQGN